MQLSIFLPDGVFLAQPAAKIIAESEHGCFCLLPHHIDFATALVPGLLAFAPPEGGSELLALGAGTLVKQGNQVRVAVRTAVRAPAAGTLAGRVRDRSRQLDGQERAAATAAARLETDLIRRFMVLREPGGRTAAEILS